jgi:hypothetical protein
MDYIRRVTDADIGFLSMSEIQFFFYFERVYKMSEVDRKYIPKLQTQDIRMVQRMIILRVKQSERNK